MRIVHVLPGDSLHETFKSAEIAGDVVICREAFVTGPLDGDTLDDFWEMRSRFHESEDGADPIQYHESVAGEFERLFDVSHGDEVNCWFEYELFCSVNMWFCLDQLRDTGAKIFRVTPETAQSDKIWDGFGQHDEAELRKCFTGRIQFSDRDVSVASELWHAFRKGDLESISKLGVYRSPCFPFLSDVCDAAVLLDTLPGKIVRELKGTGMNELEAVFPEFRRRAGVYGFGDTQVESLMRRV